MEGPGDRETESAEDNTTVPDVSPEAQRRSLSPPTGSQHPQDPREHSSSPHMACHTEQAEAGREAAAQARPGNHMGTGEGGQGPPLSGQETWDLTGI